MYITLKHKIVRYLNNVKVRYRYYLYLGRISNPSLYIAIEYIVML